MSGRAGKLRVACAAAALSIAVFAGASPFSVLYDFTGVDAVQPQSSPLLVDSDGALVGTSPFGGSASQGSVFRFPLGGAAGSLQVVHSFTGAADGSVPFAGLVEDSAGNLYGVASAGGDSGDGTLFELARNGSSYAFERLYSFSGGADGSGPVGGLAIDAAGNLYGTTARGGAGGVGTVFEWSPGASAPTTLYAFSAPSTGVNADGALPEAPLLRDASGNLFGTAAVGGPSGDGVVFELSPAGSGYSFSVLHAFSGGEDETTPVGGLVADAAGDLFGTTSGDSGIALWGTVFELQRSGGAYVYRTLHAFQDAEDGASPYASLVLDPAGDLFGTAAAGGASNAGTIFELFPAGSDFGFRLLYQFSAGFDGGLPAGGLVADAAAKLYGTTLADGVFGWGTIFALVPPPSAASRILTTAPGVPVAVDLSTSDPSLPGAAFTFAVASPPAHGTLSPIGGGRTTYAPDPAFRGSDSFTYTAADANGTSNPATISITVSSPEARRVIPAVPPDVVPAVEHPR